MFMSDILKQLERVCLLAFSSKPDKPNRFDNSSSILAISMSLWRNNTKV
jgi:hypothetical protein